MDVIFQSQMDNLHHFQCMTDIQFDDALLAKRMKETLHRAGRTLKNVAEEIQVPYRTLQNQLNGKSKISAIVLMKFLDATNTPLWQITTGEIYIDEKSVAEALATVLREYLLDINFDDHSRLVRTREPLSPEQLAKVKRTADTLSYTVAMTYRVFAQKHIAPIEPEQD